MSGIPHAGELLALATACCWTATSLAFEGAGRRVGSLAVNLLRLVVAVVLLGAWGALSGAAVPVNADAASWGWLALSGLVGFTFGDLCLFRALVVMGSARAQLFMALAPPLTALIGWFALGEGLSALDLVGMGLAAGGVAFVVTARGGSGPPLGVGGVLLGLGGALGQAGGLVLSKIGIGELSAFEATQIRVIAGIAGFSALYTVIGRWGPVRAALADRPAMARVGLGAFFGPFLGVSCSLAAVRLTEAGVAAALMSLTPVLVLVPTALLGRERVTARAVVGAAVAVGGGALLFL